MVQLIISGGCEYWRNIPITWSIKCKMYIEVLKLN